MFQHFCPVIRLINERQKKGSQGMIEELYKKYYEELINWCHSMTGNLYTAEELVHEAFLRAMLHEDTLSTLKEQQSRSWLYRTVKNLYVDRLRHDKKEIISDEFSQLQIDSEELVRLEWEKLLETLPDLEGVIFSLRYLEGYNSKQIGDILLLSPGTVRSKLSSARQHLKRILGGNKYV
ncbi:MAG: RNA polymerase sigma factor [[Ruminococcus] gnavus]|nr:RNA polymerase sigma factor [Mediterraneibacter gnavus]